jgi:hypothetical protein
MKNALILLPLFALIVLFSAQVQMANAWCTPRILHFGDIIDSSTVQGHDDINRYSCTGTTNWNGKAHVYKITHGGDSLLIHLDWQGNSNHALGVFVLRQCNQNTCIAYDPHTLNLRLNAGEYWIVVDSRTDAGTHYRLTVTCGDHRLPVELLSFAATDAADGVHLAWATASETDNSSFRVERQMQDTDDWTLIGQVTGQGQSTARSDYSFVDQSAEQGMTYAYRLLSMDLNGASHELQLVTASHGSVASQQTPTEFRLLANYPNPFNPTTRIAFDVPAQGYITLRVFDIGGRLISTLLSEVREAGHYEVTFDGANLPSGVYFAQLVNSQQSQMMKMILLK